MFDGKTFATEVATRTKAFVERQLGPLRAELAEVKAELAALKAAPAPKDGQDGKDADPVAIMAMVDEAVASIPVPKDGKDASPEQIAAEVAKVLATWEHPKDGESVTIEQLQPAIEATVDKAMAARPVPKDGIGLAGVLKDHEGCLVFTLSDGTMSKVGLVDGEKGKDGLDGKDADPEAMQAAIDIAVQKTTLAPLATAYKGVWAPGTYKAGDAVTCSGSLFIAASDTDTKPETGDAWKLAVKRGRDGRDGELKAPAERKPVKL